MTRRPAQFAGVLAVVAALTSCAIGGPSSEPGYFVLSGSSNDGSIELSATKCGGLHGTWEVSGEQSADQPLYAARIVVEVDESGNGSFEGRAALDGGSRIEAGPALLEISGRHGTLTLTSPDPASPLGGEYPIVAHDGVCPQ